MTLPGEHARAAIDSVPLAVSLAGAAEVVAAVLAGRSLTGTLARRTREAPAAGERGAIQDLCYGSLRDYGRGDFFIARLAHKPVEEPALRALLLVALARLEARPDSAHTTVDQAVDAAAMLGAVHAKSFVNAVLRAFLRRREELVDAAAKDDVARYRHPRWWLERLRRDHPRRWRSIAEAGNTHPPMALRVNLRRATPAGYLALLAAEGIRARACGDTCVLLERPLPVSRLPGLTEGLVSVQDAGAQRAGQILDVRNGMRVLDACAAPGGKAAHILEGAAVRLLALDASGARCALIRENLARLGLEASVRTADCREPAAWWDGRPFERILLDAPCSASGVVRRHPDAKWLRRPEDIARFGATQAQMLEALWQVLAAGGKLLYATCSVFAEENGQRIAAFATAHADCIRLAIGGEQACQLFPCEEHDGFFYAPVRKGRA